VIKQFNFYDIYGYLLPGLLLLGLLWLPVGVITSSWPDQDLSKALFLGALAYIVGHLIQTVASPLVPSKLTDSNHHLRAPSDLVLDRSNSFFSSSFKIRLAVQVATLFGLDLAIAEDADGSGQVSGARQVAFFQARSYLIAKKAANYVEQFEGLYAMMRGLGCSFCVGAAYIAGWALAFHRSCRFVSIALAILTASALALTLLSVWWHKPAIDVRWTRYLWLSLFLGAGYWASFVPSADLWRKAPAHSEWMIWASVFICLIAAAKCLSSYKTFASNFATAVWRDFSACLAYQDLLDAEKATADDDSGTD
jgi:hypothetical protein